MKEKVLSVFIDESGDFGQYNPSSPNYYVAMVLHNQEIDISKNIEALERQVSNWGYPEHTIHTGPLIRRESVYKNDLREQRKALFNALYHFTRLLDIQYICPVINQGDCAEKSKLVGASIWSGMVFLVLAIMGCILFVGEGSKMGAVYKSPLEIIAFIVFVIVVGLAEEFVYRGIIADSIFEWFGNSKAGIVLSVLLSGCIFGAMHILNVFYGQSLEESIIQMIATCMLGILLSAIYIRHKNIYGVAFLHATLNFMTMFMEGFWDGNTLQY